MAKPHASKVTVLIAAFQIYLVTAHYEHEWVVTGLLLLSAVLLLWRFSFSAMAWWPFAIFAVSGFVAEAIVVTGGAWTYETQHLLGLPVWLPILWGSVGVASIRMVEKLQRRYGSS
ncbi:MAG: hypothetical protein ACOC4E_02385 [Patescibacteria group bacterium]